MRNLQSKHWIGIIGIGAAISALVYWDFAQNTTGTRARLTGAINSGAINSPSETRLKTNGNSVQKPNSILVQSGIKTSDSKTIIPNPHTNLNSGKSERPDAESQPHAPGCITFRFQPEEKNLAQYPRHIFKLPLKEIDRKSVCIKVNGTPVRYISSKKSPNEFTIGAVLVNNPIVEVRACRSGHKCAEECTVPKDEFMEALAGEEDLSVAQHVSQGWNESDTDKKIDREIAHFKKDLRGSDEEKGLFYQDWKIQEEKPACQGRFAKNH